MGLVYNPLFDDVEIEEFDPKVLKKDKLQDVRAAGIPREDYVTLEEIEETFELSRYQVDQYLSKAEVKPFGILYNIVDGRRTRGTGRHVYEREVIDKIREIVESEDDGSPSTEDYKTMAMKMLE